MAATNILSNTSFWMLNKVLVREVGLHEALLLSDLSSKQDYFKSRNMLDSEGFFFNERKNIDRDTTLSTHQQLKASKKLDKLNLIDIKLKGVPAKNWYRVNSENVNNYILTLSNSTDV